MSIFTKWRNDLGIVEHRPYFTAVSIEICRSCNRFFDGLPKWRFGNRLNPRPYIRTGRFCNGFLANLDLALKSVGIVTLDTRNGMLDDGPEHDPVKKAARSERLSRWLRAAFPAGFPQKRRLCSRWLRRARASTNFRVGGKNVATSH